MVERLTQCSPPSYKGVVGGEDREQLGPQIAGPDMLEE